jgi:steroid delta-isomerase-like uncharacterized protein
VRLFSSMPTETQLVLIERWFDDIYGKGDADAINALVAGEFVAHSSDGSQVKGRAAFAEWVQWYRRTFTGAKWEIHDVVAEGDRIVARYSGTSTYRGGLAGIPSKNQKVRQTGIAIFRVQEGVVREMWSELGDLNLLDQLGAIQIMRP